MRGTGQCGWRVLAGVRMSCANRIVPAMQGVEMAATPLASNLKMQLRNFAENVSDSTLTFVHECHRTNPEVSHSRSSYSVVNIGNPHNGGYVV